MRHRVLYLQHAWALGGSCVSLQLLVQGLDRARFEPVIALARPTPEVLAYHREACCEVLEWPGIGTLEHTTAAWTSLVRPGSWPLLAGAALGWRRSERRTLELVDRVRPDLVHLNSAVLVPSARALRRRGIPFVWHVRETPVPGGGLRTAALRRALTRWPGEVVFLTDLARRLWTGGAHGRVVLEAVDLPRFHAVGNRAAARVALGLPAEAPVVAYLGGASAIKGIWPLLGALALLQASIPGAICVLPGVVGRPMSGLAAAARRLLPVFGSATPAQRMEAAIAELGATCRPLGYLARPEVLLAAADVLAFPAIQDHFARPVLEAWAMGTPVVASRLPMLEELLGEGGGLLVPPGNAAALAEALAGLLADPAARAELGRRGRERVIARHDSVSTTAAIEALYQGLLSRRAGAPVGLS